MLEDDSYLQKVKELMRTQQGHLLRTLHCFAGNLVMPSAEEAQRMLRISLEI